MINFQIDIDGMPAFDRAFNRLANIDDFRPVWGEVIAEFHQIEVEQFDSEGSASGARWSPLSPVYSEYKEIQFPGKPILQATGDLRDSLTDTEALGAVVRPSPHELIVGSSVPYAIFHQRGTRRMPRRPPINFNETQRRRLQKAVQRGLVSFLREAGVDVEERAA